MQALFAPTSEEQKAEKAAHGSGKSFASLSASFLVSLASLLQARLGTRLVHGCCMAATWLPHGCHVAAT